MVVRTLDLKEMSPSELVSEITAIDVEADGFVCYVPLELPDGREITGVFHYEYRTALLDDDILDDCREMVREMILDRDDFLDIDYSDYEDWELEEVADDLMYDDEHVLKLIKCDPWGYGVDRAMAREEDLINVLIKDTQLPPEALDVEEAKNVTDFDGLGATLNQHEDELNALIKEIESKILAFDRMNLITNVSHPFWELMTLKENSAHDDYVFELMQDLKPSVDRTFDAYMELETAIEAKIKENEQFVAEHPELLPEHRRAFDRLKDDIYYYNNNTFSDLRRYLKELEDFQSEALAAVDDNTL